MPAISRLLYHSSMVVAREKIYKERALSVPKGGFLRQICFSNRKVVEMHKKEKSYLWEMCKQALAGTGKDGYNHPRPNGKEVRDMSFLDVLLMEDVDDLVFLSDSWTWSDR